MKNIFKFILILTVLIGTVSCQQNRQPYHNVVYNTQGEQMVKVQDYDQNGNLIEYYIAYAMFNQLYNNGGYDAVNTYYYGHRTYFDNNYGNYNRVYHYDKSPIQKFVNNTQPNTYRESSPKSSNTYYSKPASTNTYRASSPTTYRTTSPKTSTTYRASSPSSSYKSTSTSTYRSSSPSNSYSSYKSSSPSSSSSYRSSSPSSSYKSSSSSRSSSSSSYRSSSPSSRR